VAHFDLASYQTVQERIDLLKERYSGSRIVNKIAYVDENSIIVECSIYLHADDTEPTCVDLAHEVKDASPVNRTSWVENCTTSSTGRSISLLGGDFSPKGKRPSRTEMEKVQRGSDDSWKSIVQPTIDPTKAKTTDELNTMWAEAVATGQSKTLQTAFTKRKKELADA
jgi:hypothetical protein